MASAGSRLWTELARHEADGPLPLLLLVLTLTTGVLDAVSLLGLGRIFVANMTGNVLIVGFAIAGAPGFSLAASVAALVGFLLAVFVGRRYVERWYGHRGRLVRNTAAIEFGLLLAALLVAIVRPGAPDTPSAVVVAAILAIAMGLQNTTVRRLGVPDLTTTVITMTMVGIVADRGRTGRVSAARRILAVAMLLVGAIAGALLMLRAGIVPALAVATALLGIVFLVAALRSRRLETWQLGKS
jgi:uncharacterized membrane protein YoaK (UPF0700 family)